MFKQKDIGMATNIALSSVRLTLATIALAILVGALLYKLIEKYIF
jgi:hypothetical protein